MNSIQLIQAPCTLCWSEVRRLPGADIFQACAWWEVHDFPGANERYECRSCRLLLHKVTRRTVQEMAQQLIGTRYDTAYRVHRAGLWTTKV